MKLAGRSKIPADATSVAGNVGMGSALAGVLGLLGGGPIAGLGSAAIDFAVTYPLVKGARKLRPPVRPSAATAKNFVRDESGNLVPALEYSKLETGANIGGSLLSAGLGVGLMAPEPTVMSQDQTIMHEMMQRQAVNNLQAPQAVSPGTQFQMAGLEFLNQYIRPDLNTTDLNMPMPARVQALLQQTGMELF